MTVHVLVVEDSEDQAALLRRYLERAGCTVTTVSTGEEALAAVAAHPPQLAIVDLVLPGMGGAEIADRLRAAHPECAIAITSVLDAGDYPAADAVLPKPFTGAQVRQVVLDITAVTE